MAIALSGDIVDRGGTFDPKEEGGGEPGPATGGGFGSDRKDRYSGQFRPRFY